MTLVDLLNHPLEIDMRSFVVDRTDSHLDVYLVVGMTFDVHPLVRFVVLALIVHNVNSLVVDTVDTLDPSVDMIDPLVIDIAFVDLMVEDNSLVVSLTSLDLMVDKAFVDRIDPLLAFVA